MEKKKCKYCGKKKPVDDFPIANVVKGKTYRRLRCQRCYQDTKLSKSRNKRIWLDSFKKGLECKHCGINDFRVLAFHHRDPKEKEIEIAKAIGRWGIERVKKEIAKCDVVCSNCHLILHWEKRNRA